MDPEETAATRVALRLIRQLFARSSEQGVDYVVVHGGHDLARSVASDVDIALGEPPTKRFLEILQATCSSEGFRVANILHYEVPQGFYFILAHRSRPICVHLDCLYDSLGVNTYCVPTSFLLQDPVIVDGIQTTREGRIAWLLTCS